MGDVLAHLDHFVESLPVIDGHAHNVVGVEGKERDAWLHGGTSYLPFKMAFSESPDPQMITDHSQHSLCYQRTIRDVAELLGCSRSERDIFTKRQELGLQKLYELCTRKGRVRAILLDDLFPAPCRLLDLSDSESVENPVILPTSWHQLENCDVYRVLRVESVAEQIILSHLQSDGSVEILPNELASEIQMAANAPNVVALKSIIAYRGSLDVTPYSNFSVPQDQWKSALTSCVHDGRVRLSEKVILDFVFTVAVKISTERGLPLQIHTGFGDPDLILHKANPTLLKRVVEEYPRAIFVLLHTSYPFTRDAAWMASVYGNVYMDIGLAYPLLSQRGMKNVLEDMLELCPYSKIMYSSDSHIIPEQYYLAAKWARKNISEVLGASVERGEIGLEVAKRASEMILFSTTARLYKLPVPSVTTPHVGCSHPLFTISNTSCMRTRRTCPKFTKLNWTEISGYRRSKVFPLSKWEGIVRSGAGLCKGMFGSALYADGVIAESGLGPVGEVWVLPDTATLIMNPLLPEIGICFGSIMEISRNGAYVPSAYCPRSFLQRQINQLKEVAGLRMECGFEMEFYLLNKMENGVKPVDKQNFASSDGLNISLPYLSTLSDVLEEMGIETTCFHCESGHGQVEVPLGKMDALKSADAVHLFREISRTLAERENKVVDFSPKPFPDMAGNGCHLHFSLWNEDGANIFAQSLGDKEKGVYLSNSSDTRNILSDDAHFFMAGILHHLPGLTALFCASRASYSRLAPSSWSGPFQAWGLNNREVCLRVPASRTGISNVEIKIVDHTSNPYLAIGSIIACGLDGIRRKLNLPEGYDVDPATLSESDQPARLPGSLEEALRHMEDDGVIVEAMGKGLWSCYNVIKKAHAMRFRGNECLSDIAALY